MRAPVRSAWILALAALWCCPAALAVSFNNAVLTGTVNLPASETHSFANTIQLSGATVNVHGYLKNEQQPVTVQGLGTINIHGPEGIWTDGWVSSHVTIQSGIEVLGHFGARFYAQGVNRGTIAAVPGGDGGVYGNEFRLSLDDFTNEGLIEVRPGARLDMYLRESLFQNDGVIRVQPEGVLELATETGSPLTPAALGVIENNGLTKLQRFRLAGAGDVELRGSGVWDFGALAEISDATLLIPDFATAIVASTSSARASFIRAGITGALTSAAGSEAAIFAGLALNGRWRLNPGASVSFSGAQTIAGAGAFVAASGQSQLLFDDGPVVFAPEVELRVDHLASLSLVNADLQFHGRATVDGGALGVPYGQLVNHGDIQAVNGGHLSLGGTFENHGAIRIDAGGRLNLNTAIVNQGQISVDHGSILFQVIPAAGNPLSIVDSTIYAGVPNQRLAQLLAIPRTRSEFVAAEEVDLGVQTLTIANADGHRWAMGSGGFVNGRILSADGFELRIVAPAGLINRPLLQYLTLDANVRVAAGQTLLLGSGVTGSGQVFLEGGRVGLGYRGSGEEPTLFNSNAVSKIVPVPGVSGNIVEIYGPMDNAGRTIFLKAGADWRLDSSGGISGGRIEGDPGVELRVTRGSGADLQDLTLAAPLRVAAPLVDVLHITLDDAVIHIGEPANGQVPYSRLRFYGGLVGAGEARFEAVPSGPGAGLNPWGHILESRPTDRLTIGAGVVVRTAGGDGLLSGPFNTRDRLPTPGYFTNRGLVLAENGHTLMLNTVDMEQFGTLRADAGSTLRVDDVQFTNHGRLETRGGHLQFSDDLTLADDATLALELSSALVGAAEPLLAVGNALTLGGRFAATLADGFTPTPGDMFPIAGANAIFGGFNAYAFPPLAAGLFWDLDATADALTLTVRSGAPAGDFTFDGFSSGDDFLAWQRGESPGGLVAGDLADWQSGYGATPPVHPAGAAVPEPTTLALAAMLLAAAAQRRRPPLAA